MANLPKFRQLAAIRPAIILLFTGFAVYCFFCPPLTPPTFGREEEPPAVAFAPEEARGAGDYTEFSHSVKAHRRDCGSCHKFPTANWKRVRKKDEAFPDVTDYPSHQSCLGCHRRQFFSGTRPAICTICHTNPSPRNSTRHAFPNPREAFDLTAKGRRSFSEFEVDFPHEKHLELFGGKDFGNGREAAFVRAGFVPAASESCAMCHQTYAPQEKSADEYFTKPPEKIGDGFWLKKGTFKTSPTGHTQCFTCHSTETGIAPAPSNCAVCHKLAGDLKPDFPAKEAAAMTGGDKIALSIWRRRDSAGTFRHEFESHADLDCATCHAVAEPKSAGFVRRVAVTSCSGCHITETADDGGILNYEIEQRKKDAQFQCTKCHIVYGSRPVPASHERAVAAMGGK